MSEQKLIEQMYKRLSDEINPTELAELEQLIATDQEIYKDWVIFLAEQYLDGELEQEKYKSFVGDFPQLPAEVSRQREIRMVLREAAQDNLRVELKHILPPVSNTSASTVKPLFQRSWVYAVAAAVILLLALPFIFNNSANNLSNQEVFAENFQAFDMRLGTTRGTLADSLKDKIQTLYKSGSYQSSLPLLEQLIQQEPDNPTYRLYLGICYIGMKSPAPLQAIPVFQSLEEDLNFGQAAQWYLALAYILNENNAAGEKIAKTIAQQPGHSYRTQAAKLLEDLGQ